MRENTGSTADQLNLAEIARRWGWPEDRILRIDEDLGLSGTSYEDRPGFQRVLNLTDRGEVGLILVRDVSRIARQMLASELFLEKATAAGVLLYVNGQLIDLAAEQPTDLLSLRVQNVWAWFENLMRTKTMSAARLARARGGYAVSRPPIGYVRAEKGRWIKDPHPGVQDAVQRVFDLYPRLGSIGKVLAYLHRENLLFPHRVGGEVRWEPTSRAHIDVILRNPNYTGDYVYRRRKFTRMSGSRKPQIRSRHQSEWIATTGHHPAYVSHETWQRIQDSLAANRPAVRPPVGRGSAVLQGLVWCQRCERWMATTYQGRDGTVRYPSYQCRVRDRSERLIHPTTFPAKLIDQHVAARVLAALNPVDMHVAIQTIEEHQLEQDEIAKAKTRRLQQAHDQVEALSRRHALIDPQHKRLLARVEGELERALADVDQLKRQFAAEAAEAPPTLTQEDAADLVRLTTNIGKLWSAPTTTNEGHKRLLRAAISHVVVRDKTDETIDLEIVWVGGHTEHLEVLRSGGINKLVGVLWDEGKNAPAILDELQARGITNRRGRPMSKLNVKRTLTRVGRSDSQRILALIKQRHEAGESYRVIAGALNAAGVRPMRAASFSAELVQALLYQARVRAAKAQQQDVDGT